MSTIQKLIHDILPNKKVFYRLQDLLHSISTSENKDKILLSIEKSNHTREFCQVTLDELGLLYMLYPKTNRSFYECIPETSTIKAYIDFEYLLENNSSVNHDRAVSSCLKILFFCLNNLNKSPIITKITIPSILKQFLVLNASTSSKISYHFIHVNPTVLFENTKALGIFMKTIFHSLLLAVAKHTCLSPNITIDSNNLSIQNLISFLSIHINKLRFNCSKCFIINDEISAADIAHLIVSNQKNEWSLSIDLHVYSKNQEFRLYDSIKNGLNNPLITTLDYPFEQAEFHYYFDILRKSLITNINNIHVPLVILKDEHFFISQPPSLNNKNIQNDMAILKDSNATDFLKPFLYPGSNLTSFYKEKNKSSSVIQTKEIRQFSNTIFDDYTPFINNIITQDNKHIGKIHSCAQGSRNTNKLFFNIGGEYRFCPKKGTHHKRNSTAIIIDMSNNTYAIRCKDPQCDNTILTWHKIH